MLNASILNGDDFLHTSDVIRFDNFTYQLHINRPESLKENYFLKKSPIIRSPKVLRLHKISLVTPVLSQFILVTPPIFYFIKMRFNIIIHLALSPRRFNFPSCFPNVLPSDTSTFTVLFYLESSSCVYYVQMKHKGSVLSNTTF